MIYLIDDKKQRQSNFGWNSNMLNDYRVVLCPIYSKQQLDTVRETIFSGNNVILFHDSFFDNPLNKHEKNPIEIRQELIKYATREKRIVVFFSGSIGSRNIEDTITHVPVEILYQNLEVFCKAYQTDNNATLVNLIVYGKEYFIVEQLIIKKRIWDLLYDFDNSSEFILTQKLSKELDNIERITGKNINTNIITVGYFKYCINEILRHNE